MPTLTAFAKFRRQNGLTLDAAAERLQVDRTTILRWEKGSTLIPIKRLDSISRVTGIPRHELRPDLAAVFGSAA